MEQDSRDTNIVVIKTNIEPAEKVLFRLTYEELLERKQGSYKQTFMVNPGQIVEDYIIKVNINESLPIALLVAPQLKISNELILVKRAQTALLHLYPEMLTMTLPKLLWSSPSAQSIRESKAHRCSGRIKCPL